MRSDADVKVVLPEDGMIRVESARLFATVPVVWTASGEE
jgi:hypothetical protein